MTGLQARVPSLQMSLLNCVCAAMPAREYVMPRDEVIEFEKGQLDGRRSARLEPPCRATVMTHGVPDEHVVVA